MDFPLSAQPLLITGRSSNHLAPDLVASLAARPIKTSLHIFADYEMQPFIHESLHNKTIYIIQATNSPESQIELFLLIDAARGAGAKHIIVVIPYFGYARQDRRFGHSSYGATLMARLLETAGTDEVIVIDPHNPALLGFFRTPIQAVLPTQLFFTAWKQQGLDLTKLIMVAPDAGSYKRALAFSRDLNGEEPAVLCKERTGMDQCRIWGLAGSVNGRPAMLVDEIIASGSTLLQTAEILVKEGATAVYATSTHLVTPQILSHFNESPIAHLFVTDSLPHPIYHQKVTVVSLVPLLADTIGRFQPPPERPPAPSHHYLSHIPSFIGSGKAPLSG